jgi:amidase
MSVQKPPREQLRRLADQAGFNPTEEELAALDALAEKTVQSFVKVAEAPETKLRVRYPRDRGQHPDPATNPLNAWRWRTRIRGADSGKLKGKRVAIKDNTCVADVPMAVGSAVLEGYVPEVDATLVTRILDAGGEILGKATCEDLMLSGGSHTSESGPVPNPYDHSRMAGGSSSGPCVLVATGEVDLANGSDQGGSIRIPAAWCGVAGIRPTYGLIPYTGVLPVEVTLDTAGVIARTVEELSVLLEVLAGSDGYDFRQPSALGEQAYADALTGDAAGLRVGIVQEGFGWEKISEEDVEELVRAEAMRRFRDAGASVEEVSIPMHRQARHIWNAVAIEGANRLMIEGMGLGTNWMGYYMPGLTEAFAEGWKARADRESPSVKLTALLGRYMHETYGGRIYAKAQNLRLELRLAYDRMLEDYDVLVMPTTPMKPLPLPAPDAGPKKVGKMELEMINNTCAANLTWHPSISVDAGRLEGLPVGLTITGRRWDERTLLRAAHAFEQRGRAGNAMDPDRREGGSHAARS